MSAAESSEVKPVLKFARHLLMNAIHMRLTECVHCTVATASAAAATIVVVVVVVAATT